MPDEISQIATSDNRPLIDRSVIDTASSMALTSNRSPANATDADRTPGWG